MGFHHFTIFAFLALTLVASHAASPLPPQAYWNSVLPNTPMPECISELVQPDFVHVIGKREVSVDPGKNFAVDKKRVDSAIDSVWDYRPPRGPGKNFVVDKKDVDSAIDSVWDYRPPRGPGKKFVVDKEIPVDRTRKVYFLEKEIHVGNTMKYRLGGNTTRTTFLSRKTADALPFSSTKLPQIFQQFSVKPRSLEADKIIETIVHCEGPAMKGEKKYCATSLESMIDFATSQLGRDVQIISPQVEKGAATQQSYRILPGVQKIPGNEMIACHKMMYEYAVFYCHELKNTRAYVVPVVGADGTKAKAIAVCHVNTAEWSPTHYSFRALNLKPGTSPICHFIRNKNFIWFRNQQFS